MAAATRLVNICRAASVEPDTTFLAEDPHVWVAMSLNDLHQMIDIFFAMVCLTTRNTSYLFCFPTHKVPITRLFKNQGLNLTLSGLLRCFTVVVSPTRHVRPGHRHSLQRGVEILPTGAYRGRTFIDMQEAEGNRKRRQSDSPPVVVEDASRKIVA